jgi:hypothetical protein
VLEVAASGQFVLGSCSVALGMAKAQGLALAGDFAVERKGFVHTYQAVRFEQANESSVLWLWSRTAVWLQSVRVAKPDGAGTKTLGFCLWTHSMNLTYSALVERLTRYGNTGGSFLLALYSLVFSRR